MQIVIAWTEEDQQLVKIGRVDLGESHTFKTVRIPKACMWLNKGNESDLAKARAYALTEGRIVLCYQHERDPLSTAKRQIISM